MKAGETLRLYCMECSTEFDLCLEPKAVTSADHKKDCGDDEMDAICCPFCQAVLSDDEDDEE